MNQKSNKYLSFFALYIFIPLAITKLLWSVSLYFLDKDSLNVPKEKDYTYYYNINLAKNIVGSQKINKATEVIETHNRIDEIKLKGTYVSQDSSFIILEDQLGTTFLYLNEKYIGYTLIKVYDNSAVLEKNGKKYDIVIENSDSKSNAKAKGAKKSTSDTNELQDKEDNDGEDFIIDEPTQITRKELNGYIKNPNKIWKNVRIQEVRNKGKLDGFRVNYVKKGSFFEKAGLKSGDVIKSIDGKEIESLADVMKYYSNIDNINGLNISVSRGSDLLDLEFNVN